MSETAEVIIYHNPRCSKSRQTLALITAEGITPTIIEYLKDAPSTETLDRILGLLDLAPRALMRRGEAEYGENNLASEDVTRAQLIQAMVDFPKLIERPIVLANGKAALGRPPEDVLKIL